jgi:hypothetical protein
MRGSSLPFLLSPSKDSLILLRRRVKLRNQGRRINKSKEVFHESSQAGGRVGRS